MIDEEFLQTKQHNHEINLQYISHNLSEAAGNFASFRDNVLLVIKLIVLINAGACVALLGFIGAIYKNKEGLALNQFSFPLLIFVFGIVAAAISGLLSAFHFKARVGYLRNDIAKFYNEGKVSSERMQKTEQLISKFEGRMKINYATFIALIVLSSASFIYGCASIALIFEKL